jgi:hypothetical protein
MPVALQDFSGFYESLSYELDSIPCPDKSITLIIISDTKILQKYIGKLYLEERSSGILDLI